MGMSPYGPVIDVLSMVTSGSEYEAYGASYAALARAASGLLSASSRLLICEISGKRAAMSGCTGIGSPVGNLGGRGYHYPFLCLPPIPFAMPW